MKFRLFIKPKSNRLLAVKKTWRSRRKVMVPLVAGALTIAGGIGSLLIPEAHAYTSDAFVMVVKTDNPGTSSATSFTIPITGAGYSYNVDCNDDGVNEVTARTTSYTCIYGSPGTYTVAITGTFPRIYFNNAGDRQKLLEVKQWGTIAWTSMQNAFYGATNLHVTATDAPNLAGVTNMSGMFREATSFNENINHWDTSKVANMAQMFQGATAYNQPLNNWNTSAVTSMQLMFAGLIDQPNSFNQSIGDWDTGKVTNMASMFYNATAFNQPIGAWNTAAVTNMSQMFMSSNSMYRQSFNQPIGTWNTAAVTNMSQMFSSAISFNQPLNFNTSAVTDMSGMFSDASAFNQPLNFNTSAVTNMSYMFQGASAFNQPLTNFNTSAVTDMSYMFNYASAFNQPLTNFNTSAVTDMGAMFDNSGYTTATYDQTLAHFASQTLQPNVALGANSITYCNDTAHIALTSPPNN